MAENSQEADSATAVKEETRASAVSTPPAEAPVAPVREPAVERSATRGRRARLVLSRVDPWSVMKLAFLLALAAAVVTIVAAMVLWGILKGLGVFGAINDTIGELSRSDSGKQVDISGYLSFPRWLGLATLAGVMNVILMTAAATLTAFLYNIATSLVGGVQVTLSEDT